MQMADSIPSADGFYGGILALQTAVGWCFFNEHQREATRCYAGYVCMRKQS